MTRLLSGLGAVAVALIAGAAVPGSALAHGPVAPVASSYLARLGQVPSGLVAKVVDGDQRMWLRVPRAETVVVLDYRGAPYVRFTSAGVQLNQNSSMYYLNQTPVALPPPANLTASTPPKWQQVSGGHDYSWHDGRLHALAAVARTPGKSFVGTWRVPLLINDRASAISGGLWYAPSPSPVWFWPIVVLLLCVGAAWRVRAPSLDARVARALGIAALLAIGTAAAGQELHGHPAVTVVQLIELAALLAFVAWGLRRTAFGAAGHFTYVVIGFVAIWQGALLIPTLLDGFVLIAIPAFAARAASVVGVGAGLSLLLLGFRLADNTAAGSPDHEVPERQPEDETAWELT
jgi:hypothetical protein